MKTIRHFWAWVLSEVRSILRHETLTIERVAA
jgi:hypothetical protein